MLLIPEIETVVILVPRAGSTSIKNAVMAKYPKAMLLYRHMEADGVPHGYDRWKRVGVVRSPLYRLWSLYKYMRDMKQAPNWVAGYADRMNRAAAVPFDQWLVNNTNVFTDPYVAGAGHPGYWPRYAVMHPIPENRKSQFLYLRPDLGTKIYKYQDIDSLAYDLGLGHDLPRENGTVSERMPKSIGEEAEAHVRLHFGWDLAAAHSL